LDEELPPKDVFLLKIDVEGFEENVLTKGGKYIECDENIKSISIA